MDLPSAFTPAGLAEIRGRIAPPNRIEIDAEDGGRQPTRVLLNPLA